MTYINDKLKVRWDEFVHIIKHENRFTAFQQISNPETKKMFKDVVDLLEEQTIRTPYCKGTVLYRARIGCYSSLEELTAPRPEYSTAQRMSPKGISYFYGAFEKDTCIAEIRPTIGSSVTVATFGLLKTLTVIDLTKRQEVKEWLEFLNDFQDIISKPISLEDADMEYLPSQAFTEYIKGKAGIDGITYKSAQYKNGINIVLFKDHTIATEDADPWLEYKEYKHYTIDEISYSYS